MQTQKLAKFISELRYDTIPDACIKSVKRSLIDSLGCAASGASAPWSKAVFNLVKNMAGKEEASIWFTGVSGPASMVPLVTSTMIHSYWFDDIHGAKVHPGAVVMPAVLATSEAIGGISGKQMLTAMVAGAECLARVSKAADPVKVRLQGLQPSTVCGSFGAAAGAAKILSLNIQQVSDTLGLASGFAAGNYAFSIDGSAVEMVQMGSAAQRGVMAALLARKESWNSNYGLDAQDGGFCRLFNGGETLSNLTDNLGVVFEMQNLTMKTFPVCGSLLSYVEAAINLARENNIDPKNVRKVKVGVAKVVELQCGHPYRQLGILHAEDNLRYCVAVAMFSHGFTINHLQPKWMNNKDIIDFIPRIETYLDPEIDASYPAKFSARIEAEMKDGSIYSSYVDTPTGSKDRPLSDEQLVKKFMEQVDGVVESEKAKEIVCLINNLENMSDVTVLTKLLA